MTASEGFQVAITAGAEIGVATVTVIFYMKRGDKHFAALLKSKPVVAWIIGIFNLFFSIGAIALYGLCLSGWVEQKFGSWFEWTIEVLSGSLLGLFFIGFKQFFDCNESVSPTPLPPGQKQAEPQSVPKDV